MHVEKSGWVSNYPYRIPQFFFGNLFLCATCRVGFSTSLPQSSIGLVRVASLDCVGRCMRQTASTGIAFSNVFNQIEVESIYLNTILDNFNIIYN